MLKSVYLTLAMFATSLQLQVMAFDIEYTGIEKPKLTENIVNKEGSLIDWTPMSIKALGYDIREVWHFENENWTFGGLGFSR